MTGWARKPRLREEYRKAWEAMGVTCIFLNAGEEHCQPGCLLKRLFRFVALTDAFPDLLQRTVTVKGILTAPSPGQTGALPDPKCVPLTGNLFSVEDELRRPRVFAHLGVKMLHLTYNRRNRIGNGCAQPANSGLSEFGRV